MKVLIWNRDVWGCGHYRLLYPAMALMTQGADVEIDHRGPKAQMLRPDGIPEADRDGRLPGQSGYNPPATHKLVGLAEIPKADVVVMQRPAQRWWSDVTPFLQEHGIRVIVDLDDRYDAIHHRNTNRFDPTAPHVGPEWVERMVADADLVTVTTPALAEHYAPEKSVVLPNLIPAQWLALPTERHRIPKTVGWPGDVTQHPGDLAATKGGLAAAMKRTDWRFRVPVAQKVARRIPVGRTEIVHLTDNEVAKETGLPPAQIDDRGGSQFWDWPKLVAEFEIGIVPLAASEFNKAKCVELGMRVPTLRGVRTIGEIESGDHVWSVNGWAEVQATELQPTRQGLELRTKHGRLLRVTPEHRLWVDGEWREASLIKPGDSLEPVLGGRTDASSYVQAPWPSDSRISRVDRESAMRFLGAEDGPRVALTERWARFLGLFVGDGSCGQATQINIHCDGQDGDLIESIEDDIQSFGMRPHTQQVKTWGGEVLRRRSVGASSAHLVRFLYGLGAIEWDGANVAKCYQRKVLAVPPPIWVSPASVQAAFLSGLFEADGTCNRSNVSLTTKSQVLARDLQLLLATFGISSSISERWQAATPGATKHLYFEVFTRRHGADIFAKEIGFLSARKQARLAEMAERPHSNAYKGPILWDSVISIAAVDMETADIQVVGSEFATEGLRSHNSCLKAMEISALGIPVVMSPTPDNVRLHELGVGELANTHEEWRDKVRALIESEDYRADLGGRGREVMATLTYEEYAGRWMEAWEGKV